LSNNIEIPKQLTIATRNCAFSAVASGYAKKMAVGRFNNSIQVANARNGAAQREKTRAKEAVLFSKKHQKTFVGLA